MKNLLVCGVKKVSLPMSSSPPVSRLAAFKTSYHLNCYRRRVISCHAPRPGADRIRSKSRLVLHNLTRIAKIKMRIRNMKRNLLVAAAFLTLMAVLGVGSVMLERRAGVQAAGVQAPMFEVDPMWPKPLPNHWVMGWTVGVGVDREDHVWVVHQANKLEPPELWGADKSSSCCFAAPPVLEFDQAGNLIGHWGGPGPGYDWMDSNHGITVDYKGNVWIGGNGQGESQVLKFTQSGKFLLQLGHPNQSKGSNDVENLNKATKVIVDPATNEAYVSDGYSNKRVIVFDAETGKYKRHWGAYGHKPDDTNLGKYDPDAPPAQQFRNPVHGLEISNDGFVYVCDRVNDRLQVFRKDGTFVKEAFFAKRTLGDGSVFDVAFSKDPEQKYIYIADGSNNKDVHRPAGHP